MSGMVSWEHGQDAKKRDHDFAVTAFRVVQEAADEGEEPKFEPGPEQAAEPTEGKNPHAVALGQLGGKKGGPARAKKLTPEQRQEIAHRAATARWLLGHR
ncbi:MAG: hypothetical protein HY683_08045 [Chloroflexi bacterium]|nr:hypothetical protein [Chloroflexota bacterium]